MKKNKKFYVENLVGILPIFSCAGSRYSKMYCDTGVQGVQQGATIRPAILRHGQEAPRHGRPGREASGARALGA